MQKKVVLICEGRHKSKASQDEMNQMSDERVTISAKVSEGFQKRLDQIGEELRMTNRSDIIRSGLECFVDAYDKGRIPAVFRTSKEEDGCGQVSTKVLASSSIPPHRSIKSEKESHH